MNKIEYRGTLVCSINVSDLDRSVRWSCNPTGARFDGDILVIPGEDGVRLANFFDPDGNPLTLAEPNQPAQAST